ncbi:RidA family protein [Daejeonella lutea]|uniref:Enamine deaminase RidA, house cleaning of reactive enamine intermediates, YjgF/YER057c/UK114 family n=1 Tax=Daejeonella lutea TaxID=572036 RepID=A0A1T5A615_9SPHI|nr:RidA family protein [Daejeonella lutea]SKB30452.1 Enamine deaminase RidA, house cleaning of reactive enamine intermediates, YjgF/YER057c/UK114 family [Daejeonella lutea]
MKRYTLLLLIPFFLVSCKSMPSAQGQSTGRVDVEAKLKELNIQLSPVAPSTASIVKTVRVGNMVYTSGHGPDKPGGGQIFGKVGGDLTLEQGQEAARLTGIALLSSLKAEIGDLSKIKRVVKVFGLVNCTPAFSQQPQVMNAFSDMMVKIWGENGRHARSAVGTNALPNNIAVEIEMIVELY